VHKGDLNDFVGQASGRLFVPEGRLSPDAQPRPRDLSFEVRLNRTKEEARALHEIEDEDDDEYENEALRLSFGSTNPSGRRTFLSHHGLKPLAESYSPFGAEIIADISRFRRFRYRLALEMKGRHTVLQLGQGDWLR
jgi:hypothetical protein